jgi:hypothetical protein
MNVGFNFKPNEPNFGPKHVDHDQFDIHYIDFRVINWSQPLVKFLRR